MCSHFIRYRIFVFTNLARPVGPLCLSSLYSNPQETQIASRNDQAVPVTNTKYKNIFAASGGTLDVTTRSKARALSALHSTPTSISAEGGRIPEARACDHPGLAKDVKGKKI